MTLGRNSLKQASGLTGSTKVAAPAARPFGSGAPVGSAGAVQVRRLEPNVLTLDYCDLKIGDTTESGLYYYRAGERVFKHFGLGTNPWNAAVQYKTNILDKNNFPADSGFELTYRFTVERLQDRAALRAVVERPKLWTVAVNGTPIAPRLGEWAFDRAFGVYDIGAAVKDGENTLTLTARPMSIHHEIEPVYITGDFGVTTQARGFKLVPSAALGLGSWKTQGLPFYPAEVAYARDFTSEGLRHSREMIRVCLPKVTHTGGTSTPAGDRPRTLIALRQTTADVYCNPRQQGGVLVPARLRRG